jgi:TRAP-type C4-dicarboxylate transport system permease small subunit
VQIMSTISLGLPLSVFAYSIPVCGALMVAQSAWNLVRRLRGLPVGVPAGQAA